MKCNSNKMKHLLKLLDLSKEEILKLTSEFYEDYYYQRQFAKFFKFSILYRNFRDKVISEVQS